ncbi:uncharacterized protein CTRU02_202964 [Colletotrichum truncatum]|uniref:Uncharacterized protein n=1 Tax=Colletotrichum truncatum TaxID=5467 RepID=A0ACC3Z7Y6_COLTU
MLTRGVLTSLALQAFVTMTLASPTPNSDVTWTVSGPKEAVRALGAPGAALEALGKAMQAKAVASADQPAVKSRETADDLLMYYNA